ncbi:SusC/RagA family TonB-linked outer membrane protein [Porphyromonas levii]|uniref:SusC/RagA family TonB-linked outer membrane protein n=1 Tax=Porphyromonas levii TaxID=28114 RepID=UPI001DB90CE3|nr:SusC/RagA family TonB-linked outer membrane protein [Porphyromonas levii]MBR8769285.1 hypothetical protein [Porphyromonas levii]
MTKKLFRFYSLHVLMVLLLSFVLVHNAQGQEQKVSRSYRLTGTVVLEDGTPAVGATVAINRKAVTSVDREGKFSCQLPATPELVISVSYIGAKTFTKKLEGERTLAIVLKEDNEVLDEVVVTGFQTISKRNWTGASTIVKPEEIITPATYSVDQALEGVVPELISMPRTGELGAVPRLRIRGVSTILGNREPLWVVDGVVQRDPISIPIEDLNDPDFINRVGNAISGINPIDIERIDVLKDAASTALYGAQAANGVIVVTTKQGDKGTTNIRYSGSVGVTQRPRYTDRNVNLMNSLERVNFSRELIASKYYYSPDMYEVGYEHLLKQLYDKKIPYDVFKTEVDKIETLNTDWFGLLMRDALSHSHSLSLSGSSGKTSYYASLGFSNNQGVVRGDDSMRTTAMLKMITEFSSKTKLQFWVRANLSRLAYAPKELNVNDYAYNTSRAIPAFDGEHQYSYYKKGYKSDERYNFNFLNELEHSGYKQDQFLSSVNASLDHKFTRELYLSSLFSLSMSNSNGEEHWDEHTYKVANLRMTEYGEPFNKVSFANSLLPYGGQLSSFQERFYALNGRLMLSYDKDINDSNRIRSSVGATMSSTKTNGMRQLYRGYFKDYGEKFVAPENIDKFPEYKNWLISDEAQPKRMNNLFNQVALFATVSYTWRDNLTLGLNGRIEGSNRFGQSSNKKLLPIWSVSGSYDFKDLLPDVSWVNYLYLRSSYGMQGNMLPDQTPVPIIKRYGVDPYYNEPLVKLERYPNPDLRWEKTQSFSAELDFAVLNNRLSSVLSYYRKDTRDAFMDVMIDLVNGYPSYVVNSGHLRNEGFSIALSVVPVQTKDFSWRLTTSFSRNFNQLKSKPAYQNFSLNSFLNGTALIENKPLGTFYSYRFKRLNPQDGGPMFYDMEEEKESLFGLSNYEVYSKVLVESGNRYPKMQGSIRNNISYKNFSLRFNLVYSLGAKTRLFKLYKDQKNFTPEMNVNRAFLDRWKQPGDEATTNIPAVVDQMVPAISGKYNTHYSYYERKNMPRIANNAWDMYNYSDIRVVSADFLKCADLTLSYALPNKACRALRVKNAFVSFGTNNLFIIASPLLKGQMPVQGGFTEINLSERPQYRLDFSFSL